uniref:mRNA (guanine-N(7))-methyltransferase n=1 Tax=Brassica oleracea var. oleracea TaxID=109376 RepID=A0A0D2ZXC6_BRAOL
MLLIALNGLSFNIFKSLAEEYDLELVFVKNSHEVVHEYMKKTEFVELMRRLGALGDGNQDQSTLSADECDAAYLYLSFVLRKVCLLSFIIFWFSVLSSYVSGMF